MGGHSSKLVLHFLSALQLIALLMLLTWSSSAAQPVAFNAPQDFAVRKIPVS